MDAANIAKHILEHEPSLDFLENVEQHLTAGVLAEVVKTLRKSALMPRQLLQTRMQWSTPVIDVCGTGGSKTSRLNTSTLVALFAPDLGYAVMKHGGRSASGKVGSLDLLEKLGLDVPFLYEHSAECLRATGLCYLGAGLTYSAFARYSHVRKSFGRPSIFNVLGPLLNPAQPGSRLLGTYKKSVAELLASTLLELGEAALVVCSEDDEGVLDEASPYGTTFVFDVESGKITEHVVPPSESTFGKRTELFSDGVQAALDFLDGKHTPEAQAAKHFVAYNLACLALLKAAPSERIQFSEHLHLTAKQIEETFDARLEKAQLRLATLRNLKPLHEHSPTRTGCKVLEENFQPTASKQPVRAFVPSSTASTSENSFEMSRGLLFAEIKVRTPLKTFESPLPITERLSAYNCADAISVVTHPQFGGSLALLQSIRALTKKPLLAKDFVRSPLEIEKLAAAGADGILLLEDMVRSEELELLVQSCVKLGVTPFIESSWGLPTRLHKNTMAVLNSRNLFSLEEGRRFRDEAARRSGPKEQSILASSLSEPLEVFLALQEHAGVIVGSALMKLHVKSQIEIFLEAATRTRPLLKTCGARSLQDVELALENGADFVGINLIPTSKRFASEEFLKILESAPLDLQKKLVFITSLSSPPDVLKFVSRLKSYEQAYGAPLLAGRQGLFATRFHGTPSENPTAGCLALVLDSSVPGSGKTEPYFENTDRLGIPTLAAGGVTPENVMERFEQAVNQGWNVCGIDVASGVEKAQGSAGTGKGAGGFDKARIRALFSALANQKTTPVLAPNSN